MRMISGGLSVTDYRQRTVNSSVITKKTLVHYSSNDSRHTLCGRRAWMDIPEKYSKNKECAKCRKAVNDGKVFTGPTEHIDMIMHWNCECGHRNASPASLEIEMEYERSYSYRSCCSADYRTVGSVYYNAECNQCEETKRIYLSSYDDWEEV